MSNETPEDKWPDFTNNLFVKTFKNGISPIELLSLVSVGIVALCFLISYQYYAQFGIDITSYLDTTEIIFSFSGLFSSLVSISGIFLMFGLGFASGLFFVPRKFPLWLKVVLGWVMIVVGAFLGILIFKFPYSFNPYDGAVAVLILAIILIGLRPKGPSLTIKTIIICVLIMSFFSFRSTMSYNEITEKKKHTLNVEIRFPDFTLRTSPDFFYIGATRNYIFFWDDLSKKAITYPTKDIKWISTQRADKTRASDLFKQ